MPFLLQPPQFTQAWDWCTILLHYDIPQLWKWTSYLDVAILCISLGIDLLQQKTKMSTRSHFKRLWEVCANTPAIQDVHCLLPADSFAQLIDKLMFDASHCPVSQRGYIRVNWYDWFTQVCSSDGTTDCRYSWMHKSWVKCTRHRQLINTLNSKFLPIFLNKFQCLQHSTWSILTVHFQFHC